MGAKSSLPGREAGAHLWARGWVGVGQRDSLNIAYVTGGVHSVCGYVERAHPQDNRNTNLWRVKMAPPARLELTLPASEAGALSN